ncbi:MAG: hypothetical protein V1866_05430 [archaeon]
MIEEVIREIELPCFVYETKKVTEQISRLKNSQPRNLDIFYAMKANPQPEILKVTREENLGIEVASIGEMEKAFLAGFKPENMLVTGPGKTDQTLEYALKSNAGHIIIESLNEAKRLDQIAGRYNRRQPVLIRVSPANAVSGEDLVGGFALFGGKPVKYGIDEENLQQVMPELMKLNMISVEGIHVFAASGVSDYRLLIRHVDEIFDLVQNLKKSHLQISIIDFGGGFGYSHDDLYQFDTNSYFSELNQLVELHSLENKRLFLELGAYIAAPSGTYVTEIVDVKQSRGENFLIVNGGIHHLLRPSLVSNHAIRVYDRNGKPVSENQSVEVNIAGNLCHPLDLLARGSRIPVKPENLDRLIGGKVAVLNCGAYGANFSISGFSLNDNPSIYVIDKVGNLKRC